MIRNGLKPFLKLSATHLFSCGEKAALWLYGKNALSNPRVTIVRNVIEADRFAFKEDMRTKVRRQYGIAEGCLLLGEVARFTVVKNQSFAIDILKEVLATGRDAKLMLIGQGSLEAALREKTKKEGLEDKVIFTGVVSNVYDYEQALDVFLLPSLYEGLPLSLVEAQVAGLPCFAGSGCPSEGDVTGLCQFLQLDKGAAYWAKQILSTDGQQRTSRYDDIIKAGYDAANSAKWLQQFYLEVYR